MILNVGRKKQSRGTSPRKQEIMIKREYSDEERTCIENVFNYYIKRSIEQCIEREALKCVKREKACILTPTDKISTDNEVDFTKNGQVIPVYGYIIPIDNDKLYCVLNQIREVERDAVLLNICVDMPLYDVAHVMKMNYSTIRNNKCRGLEKLKELLKKYGLH